jgi:(p)ppGpp synthase/HD superfamily hydrolase
MSLSLEQTRDLMRRAHAGQVDKAGKPYHTHPERVLEGLLRRFPEATESEQHAALLHDVIEDTKISAEDLAAAGYPREVIDLVSWLTRPPGLSYLEWMARLADAAPLGALRVKLADNADNSDPVRLAALPEHERGLAQRYEQARAILEAALSRRAG